MNTLEICPICCEGSLIPYSFSAELRHRNIIAQASNLQSSKCDSCDSSVATHAQTKHNKMLSINFARAVDGILTTHEVLRIRKKLGLSQRQASALIAGGGNSFSKYENGTIRQSLGVDNMLRLLDNSPHLLHVLCDAQDQRKALAAVQTEIYLPIKSTKSSASPIAAFIKTVTSVASTVFSVATHEEALKESWIHDKSGTASFVIFGSH